MHPILAGLFGLAAAAGFACGIGALSLVVPLNTAVTQQRTTIAEMNVSLASAQQAVSSLTYELAMTAMSSVTSTTTVVGDGTIRWYSTCQGRTGTITYEILAGEPESSYSTAIVTTSNNISVWVLTIGPASAPIVHNVARKPCCVTSNLVCSVGGIANTASLVGVPTSPAAIVPLSPQTLSLDPPCDGVTNCILSDTIVVGVASSAITPWTFNFVSWYNATAGPTYGEDPFVARNLTIAEPLHIPFFAS
jgi:hypothetical protein